MSARDEILGGIRRALSVTGREAPRRRSVTDRLEHAPKGIIPARGQGGAIDRLAMFRDEAERVSASTTEIETAAQAPAAVAAYLHERGLPAQIRMGGDSYLAALPWALAGLEVTHGPAAATDLVCVSHAFAAVAETGTLALASGPANPTTLNFLPETHLVLLRAQDILGDYEAVFSMLREAYGKGEMPRVVNFITGPSRSADIAHALLLGAHGPRSLHILIVVGEG